MRTLRAIMNEGQPGKLPDAARLLKLGDALACMPRTYRGTVVGHVLVLPETAKCRQILSVFVAAGTVSGRFTPTSEDATPATTQAGVNAAGDIVFVAGDAVTQAEVVYLPWEGEIYTDLLNVVTHVGTLLQGRRAAQLLSVEALVGTAVGVKALDELRGATPAAGSAAITLLGTGVEFAAADAVTQARVRYVAQPGTGSSESAGTRLNAEDKAF